jgi:quinol monooxygenase YgiN
MSHVGFLVRIQAVPEYAEQVADVLRDALELARAEEGTITWFAFRDGPTSFGVFDTFADEDGRNAHLHGKIGDALRAIAPTMFAAAPEISPHDLLAIKLP